LMPAGATLGNSDLSGEPAPAERRDVDAPG
jgi:hypothetical protein